MDFIPYHPYLVNKFYQILKDVYNIKDNAPPEKNNPSLPDDYIRQIFEIHQIDDWLKIKDKYNVRFIITPSNWKLKLNLILKDDVYNLYEIL